MDVRQTSKEPIQKKTFLYYSLFFVSMLLLIYSGFVYTKTSFIWDGDGLTQHYLLFYDYLEKLRGFFNGEGFPQWNWNIGMGADVIHSYGYYVIGDPFVYLGLLFPKEQTELAYHLIILLRLGSIGASFLFYARKMKLSHQAGLVGAGMYTFTHYAMMNVIRHPFFMLPMIWFPLLCLGMEKILQRESSTLFSVMIALSAFSNFYFFYKLTMLSILYAGVRLFQMYRAGRFENVGSILWKGISAYAIGVLIAGVLFIPMVDGFLGSSRGTGENPSSMWVYPLMYYPNLLLNFLTPGSFLWTVGGFSIFSLFALPFIWKRRGTFHFIPILLTILGVGVLFPLFGSFMNGFSGPYNRFTFVIPFYLALAGGFFLDHRTEWTCSQRKWTLRLLSFFTVFLVLAVSIKKLQVIALYPLVIGWLLWVLLQKEYTHHKNYSFWVILLIWANMAGNSMVYYYPPGKNTMHTRIPYGTAENSYAQLFDGIEKNLPEEGTTPYRVGVTSEDTEVRNQFIYLDLMGLNSYLSVTNRAASTFSDALETSQVQLIQPLRKGFDDRREANHYLGVKYILTEAGNEAFLPFGYEVKKRVNGTRPMILSETDASFPFAYAERNWLSKKEYDQMNPVEKEAFLIEGVTTEEDLSNSQIHPFEKTLPIKKIPFEWIRSDGSKVLDPMTLDVQEKNTRYQLKINQDELRGKDVFLYLDGVTFTPNSSSINGEKANYTATAQLNGKEKEVYQNRPLSFSSYFERKEILFNMGYVPDKRGIVSFSLDLNLPGEYAFDDVNIFVLEADKQKDFERAEEKRKDALKLTRFEQDTLEGDINLDRPAVLVTSIPYTKGWSARVNAKTEETIEVNNGFVGLPLSSGESHVVLSYKTPHLTLGFFVTVGGWVWLFGRIIVNKKREERKMG